MRSMCAAALTLAVMASSFTGVAGQDASKPSPTDAFLASFETEEAAPGVHRLLGVGSMFEPDVFSRLPAVVRGNSRRVAPDGTVWEAKSIKTGRSDDRQTHVIRSYDGDTWTTHRRAAAPRGTGPALDIAADGTVWAAFAHPKRKALVVARYTPDGWERFGGPIPGHGASPKLTAADDGTLWITGDPDSDRTLSSSRLVDGAWERIRAPRMAQVGRDGTLWGIDEGIVIEPVLARFDVEGWQQFDLPRAVGGSPLRPRSSGLEAYAAAPDGSIWLALERELGPYESEPWCGQGQTGQGLWRFDGGTREHYLADACVEAVRVAPDDAVFVSVIEPSEATYVLTPDAWDPAK